MKSLQQILKVNGQSLKQVYQTGKFNFNKTAGCLVHNSPGVNNYRKDNKNTKKESLTQQ